VRSSTSSSERVPADPRGHSLLLALLLAGLFLIGWEALWRSAGVGPTPGRDEDLWGLRRLDLPAEAIALIGTSRIEANVDPDVLERELAVPAVQLAIAGSSAIPILDDLAADPGFRGTVVADLVPRVVFDVSGVREVDAEAHLAAVDVARRPSARSEALLQLVLHRALVSQRPELSLTAILSNLARGRLPTISYATLEPNGFRKLDFERLDGREREDALLARIVKTGRPANDAERDAIIARIAAIVSTIRARQGEVVFVQMPSDKRIGAYEEATYPRERYWDPLVARVGAPAIHTADVPSLRGFDCPDGSHLDHRDTERFTTALARELAPYVRSNGRPR
jgi:hypothetical protein